MLGEAPVLSSDIAEQVSHGNRLLVVDDEAISLAFLKQHLVELGYDVITADSGRQALQVLEQSGDTIDVVVLDRIMPGIDGIATAEEMRRDPSLRHIPIVMQTGADSSKDVQEGIDAGVFYYLTKPIDGSLLRSVVNAAIKESGRRRSLRTEIATQSSGMQLMQSCRFNVRTPQEAEGIACFVANCFADPERAMMGLIELTVNAVEHGNLEIGYEAKTKLLKNGELTQEIERRLADKKYAGRMVELVVVRKNGGVFARITDQGSGFDWRSYVSIDPARASDSHGRGIAQANAVAFDKVSYNESGNQVLAFMSDTPKLDW